MPVIDYRIGLLERLQDAEFADGYIEECRKLGPDEYETALEDVAEAIALQTTAKFPHNLGNKKQAFYDLVAEYIKRPALGHSHPILNS